MVLIIFILLYLGISIVFTPSPLKEKGLRKESFKSLSSFIDEAKMWDDNAQQNFACWLFALFETSEDIHHVLQ